MGGSKLALGLGLAAGCLALACLVLLGAPSSAPAAGERAVALAQLRVRSSSAVQGQHAVLKVLSPTAKLLANSMLFTAVAQHARSNPHKPGRAAMIAVLDDPKAREQITAAVENKLANTHSGEYANDLREEVPEKYRTLIPSLAKGAAVQATTMAFIDLRGNVLKAEGYPQAQDTGYLEAGSSLAGMPLTYGSSSAGKYGPVALDTLRTKCMKACEADTACKAYTFKPSEGICYLKSRMLPVRGVDCKDDCWYFGVVTSRE